MTSEEFQKLSDNVDNKKILNAVARKFNNSLDKDDLEHAKGIALWKSALSFKGGKFTTHLYKNMKWECIKLLKKDKGYKKKSKNDNFPRQFPIPTYDLDLQDLLTILSPQQKIVIDKRLENRTFKDIGKELSLTGERIRQIYKQAIEKMRKEVE